jgi:peptidoglycan/xylan/chitin deacetylase (PgdA/CDA1 family)
VAAAGGEGFFRDQDWRQQLDRLVADHRAAHPGGDEFESEAERRARIRDEMAGSRAILEEITGAPVTFFSPPQGGADHETLALALDCGYELVTAPSGGSVRLNLHGSGERWVYRCGTGFNLLPRGASHGRALLSQRITLARYAGTPGAGILTRGFGAMSRVRRLLAGSGRAAG